MRLRGPLLGSTARRAVRGWVLQGEGPTWRQGSARTRYSEVFRLFQLLARILSESRGNLPSRREGTGDHETGEDQ